VGSPRDDELARTATAPLGSSVPAPTRGADDLGGALGRYRLERELGSGGMGVVHAAFDPDLERRIALKVLRVAAPSTDAKDRLLREARAMARLSHPNVVTVHEVGTANGRDFVAMELIHGESLADWLRAEKRRPAAIIDAFVAAGRGLAAAHAAGIVHRDFKPHNVLRSREGRIVVTDFGLAREAEGALPVALDQTLPPDAASTRASITQSSLAGITVTGALLGTPAYMAPEQWSGGAVTPATDQFAYCVALWEALTGERPYRGPTLDDLRAQVAQGPAALDASRMPRRVRGILCRGLDPDPARRWPNMDALLSQLVRADRRPFVALVIFGGALVAGSVAILAMRSGGAPPVTCPPPARDVATVWSPAIAAALRAKASEAHAAVLDAAYRDWQAARTQACSAPPQVQQAQLQCLDGVLGRFDALRQGYARVAIAEHLQAELIDPAICRRQTAVEVPRLTLAATPDTIAAYQLHARTHAGHKPSDDEIAALAGAPTAEPCARVIAMLAFDASSQDVPRARALMNGAESSADQCGDERLRADLLIAAIDYHVERPMIGPAGEAAIQKAQLAVSRVTQPDLEARLAVQQIRRTRRTGRWPELFRLADAAIAGYGARGLPLRQLDAVSQLISLRFDRSETSDLEAVTADTRKWRAVAEETHNAEHAFALEAGDALARYRLGDLATAHPDMLRLWQTWSHNHRPAGTRRIEGEVVDTRGRPVAGATVTSARELGADSIGIGVYVGDPDDSLGIATTDNAGHFAIADAVPAGVVAAQLGDRRSKGAPIADRVRLVLEPTRTVSGKVELGDLPAGLVLVSCDPAETRNLPFYTFTPIKADGSFVLEGVSVGEIRVGALVFNSTGTPDDISFQTRPASRASLTGVALTVARSSRVLDVFVRSTVAAPLSGADLYVLAGKPPARSPKLVGDVLRHHWTAVQHNYAKRVALGELPEAVRRQVGADDLAAHLEHTSPGELTVCAAAIGGDLADPVVRRRNAQHDLERTLACEHLGADAAHVIISVPPQRRFD
jgi:predicted Ser/Thr protein kinase